MAKIKLKIATETCLPSSPSAETYWLGVAKNGKYLVLLVELGFKYTTYQHKWK